MIVLTHGPSVQLLIPQSRQTDAVVRRVRAEVEEADGTDGD